MTATEADAAEALWRRLTIPEAERRKLINAYRDAVLEVAPADRPFPRIQGRCPACRMSALFLGEGGYVTCGHLGCKNPCAADDLLHGEGDG